MNKEIIWKLYRKKLFFWLIAVGAIVTALYYGIDNKIIVFVTLSFGVFTQFFTGLGALISLIPLIGPLVVKIVTIPGFFLLNALGTIISGIAIKKGYTAKLAKGRVVTLGLMIGIIIGYIVGNLAPLK